MFCLFFLIQICLPIVACHIANFQKTTKKTKTKQKRNIGSRDITLFNCWSCAKSTILPKGIFGPKDDFFNFYLFEFCPLIKTYFAAKFQKKLLEWIPRNLLAPQKIIFFGKLHLCDFYLPVMQYHDAKIQKHYRKFLGRHTDTPTAISHST